MGEIPLAELFDAQSSTLRDNYHDVIRDAVNQQLEDTPWLRRASNARVILNDAGFGMYHARDRTSVISFCKPALQQTKDGTRARSHSFSVAGGGDPKATLHVSHDRKQFTREYLTLPRTPVWNPDQGIALSLTSGRASCIA